MPAARRRHRGAPRAVTSELPASRTDLGGQPKRRTSLRLGSHNVGAHTTSWRSALRALTGSRSSPDGVGRGRSETSERGRLSSSLRLATLAALTSAWLERRHRRLALRPPWSTPPALGPAPVTGADLSQLAGTGLSWHDAVRARRGHRCWNRRVNFHSNVRCGAGAAGGGMVPAGRHAGMMSEAAWCRRVRHDVSAGGMRFDSTAHCLEEAASGCCPARCAQPCS